MARPSSPTHTARDLLLLVFAQVVLGSGGTLVRIATTAIDRYAVGAVRFGLVALVLRFLHPVRFAPAVEKRLFIAGLFFVQQFICWQAAIARLPLGVASLLCATSPLWCALFETLVQKSPPRRTLWLYAVMACAGMALLYKSPAHADAQAIDSVGLLYGIGAGLGIACTMLIMRGMRQDNHAALHLMGRSTCYTAVILGGIACFQRTQLPPLTNWQPYAAAIGLALLCQGVGCCLQLVVLARVPASLVGVSTLLGPVFASVYGAVLYDEALTAQAIAGGFLIVAATLGALKSPPHDGTAGAPVTEACRAE